MVIAYKTLAEYLKKLLDQEPNRPIRILEIGAGTGSATRYLLPTLKGHKFEYYFTDYLKHFFPTAAEMFKEYPELVFKQLLYPGKTYNVRICHTAVLPVFVK